MNLLRFFSICLLATLFAACNNDRGPENDSSIKIEHAPVQLIGANLCGLIITQHKSCEFEAAVIEDELEDENRIRVLAPWGEKFWVYGSVYGPVPKLKLPKDGMITIAGYTAINNGRYVWNYFIQG